MQGIDIQASDNGFDFYITLYDSRANDYSLVLEGKNSLLDKTFISTI